MTHDEFVRRAGQIPYQYRHPEFLYGLIKWLQPKTVVEVGTHIGMSAVWMARALQEIGQGHLYCIDPFCWVNERQKGMWEEHIRDCGVVGQVTLIQGRSQEVAWPTQVDFAFIDGNHTYDVARWDVEKARDLGAKCIVMHDTVSWEGSRKYADECRSFITGNSCLSEEWSGWCGTEEVPEDHWDVFEQNFDDGLMVLLKREPKGECRGLDIGEQWDKPTGK